MASVMEARPAAEGLRESFAAFVEAERRRADVASAAIAVFDRDRVREAGAFGYADFSRGERATLDTLYRAASISKLFTTMLALREVEAGRIGLDDDVNAYLDPFTQIRDAAGDPAPITVRDLLTHTSGLPVSWKGLEYGNVVLKTLVLGTKRPRSLAEVVADQHIQRAPGGPIVYSNGGFALLGHMVARMHGRPYEELVRDDVLRPAGMRQSEFAVAPEGPGIATSYGSGLLGRPAGRKPAPMVLNYTGPAGGLITTALELARFGRMLLRGGEIDATRIVSEHLLSDAMRVQAKNHPDLDFGWGLGFEIGEVQERRLVGHSGGLAGVATRVWVMPEEGIGVVVLTNGGDAGFVSRVAERALLDALGVQPEVVPGSPLGISEDRRDEWREATRRAVGRYEMVDMVPPGAMEKLTKLTVKPRISHVGQGVLAVDGALSEPPLLYPDGEPGHYRVVTPYANGARAVIEQRPDGTHLWASILHMKKKV